VSEIQITVVATGFGRSEPRVGLIESKLRAVTTEEPAADGSDGPAASSSARGLGIATTRSNRSRSARETFSR
jgi:hypothetical protein